LQTSSFEAPNALISEYGCKFNIDWQEGQKTCFFLDQRENRKLVQHYAKGRSVLNVFCYTGGFSIYALKGEATLVHSVDSSAKAISGSTIQNSAACLVVFEFSDLNVGPNV